MKIQLMLKALSLSLLIVSCLYSCKKDTESNKALSTNIFKRTDLTNLEISFAKALVQTLKSDPDLRSFLKNEALKQFDNDYDVLYQIVKNTEVSNGETFRKKILKYISENELLKIENALPTLTIFIPTLPDFSPETWNAIVDAPRIAVANVNRTNSVSIYNYTGEEELLLNSDEVPGFPVLVVKQNERIAVKNNAVKQTMVYGVPSQNSEQSFSFEFIDLAFDGSKLNNSNGRSVDRLAPVSSSVNGIDQVNIDAYNSGVEWHRDYIYYGLTPTNTTGKLKNNYSEFITSFKFLTPEALNIIADQDGDPKANSIYRSTAWPEGPYTMWTEGNFEFRITILINAKNGIGNELTKTMSVNPRDLFDLQYKRITPSYFPAVYQLTGVTCKEFNPNIELIPWDLENYGTAWKFIFYEIDPAQEVVNSYENTSTFATNFEISLPASDKSKVGFKFGASATFTEKRTFSVKTTLNSDFLGEATLSFDQPVVIGTSGSNYITREITTGNLLSISVEPKRVF